MLVSGGTSSLDTTVVFWQTIFSLYDTYNFNMHLNVNFALAFEVIFLTFCMHADTCSLLIRLLIEVENIFEIFKDINVCNSLSYILYIQKNQSSNFYI